MVQIYRKERKRVKVHLYSSQVHHLTWFLVSLVFALSKKCFRVYVLWNHLPTLSLPLLPSSLSLSLTILSHRPKICGEGLIFNHSSLNHSHFFFSCIALSIRFDWGGKRRAILNSKKKGKGVCL